MKNGVCLKCQSTHVYFKLYEITEVRMDGKQVEYAAYICTNCGCFETFITDLEALKKIQVRAEKLGDWKKVK